MIFTNLRGVFRVFKKKFFRSNIFRTFKVKDNSNSPVQNRHSNFKIHVLLKPIVATSLVIPISFFAAAEVHKRLYKIKVDKYRKTHGLSRDKEVIFVDSRKKCERIVYSIVGLNGLVFLMWQNPKFRPFMQRFFLNMFASNRAFPLFGSSISHEVPMHLLFNMMAFSSFGLSLVNYMSAEQFISFYISSGVFCSLISKLGHVFRGRLIGGSLGASGVVIGLLTFTAMSRPNSKVSLIFLPNKQFTIKDAVKIGVLLDCIGIIRGWSSLDHYAHLAGYGFGYLYYKFVYKKWLEHANTSWSKYMLKYSSLTQ